ncbi:P-type conjugative transfer protein TrbL [Burkholderia cenocepacia]|uniref:P-type conjugative transfer protein TrbL n=1 Tax=Burkholderia cenocepacia TaxID=95486 RepID=UPI002ABE741A|nr:P-type conjugative transfer protein TrbL [Burkholderia cenocepacia]
MNKKLPVMVWAVLGVMLMFAVQAHAQTPGGLDSAGLLDDILNRFNSVASGWGSKMVSYASWLFWGLVLISMVWTYGMMALRRADIGEVLAETIRFFTVTGFFWWILVNGPAISVAIINSLRQIGAGSSGAANSLSPSGIVDIGFDIAGKVVDQSSIWSPVNSGVGILIAAVILVVLALVGVNMLLLLVSAWLLSYGAVFLLGFGGSRWTTDIAISYYKTIINIGMQLLAMILIVGIGRSFIDQYYQAMGSAMTLKSLFVMLVASVVLLVLVSKVPPMFGSIVGGGGSTGGIGSFGAGAALGAAATAAAAAATAGAAVMAGATSAAGGANALKAAFQSAQQHMAEGSGMFSGSGGGGSGGLGGGGGSGGGGSGSLGGGASSSSGGSGGFSSFMSNAGRFAADMGNNLAKGAGQVAKDKAASMMDSAKERIGQTTGGKIASEISNPGSTAQARQDRQDIARAESMRDSMRAQDARDFMASQSSSTDTGSVQQPATTASSGTSQDAFGGDSLGAGKGASQSASTNEEVADFVNKGQQSA